MISKLQDDKNTKEKKNLNASNFDYNDSIITPNRKTDIPFTTTNYKFCQLIYYFVIVQTVSF